MRALLVGPDYEENLSIRYLSSSLQAAGHDTELATFNSASDIADVASSAESANIVGLSLCFQSRAHEFLQLAQEIKARDPKKLIVAGGHYASCAAQELLTNHPELDVIVIHEGEQSLVQIADAMPNLPHQLSEIPGIAFRDGGRVQLTQARRTLDDLDTLPFPDRRGPIHFIAGIPTSYLMGSRGCYGNCAYCCITTLHRMAPGKRFRQRGVDRIADEMLALYQERGTRQFVFHDDNFLVPSESLNLARIEAFEKALDRRRISDIALVIKCRPADASRKVLGRLKDLGLVRVFLGVESATEQGLFSLERTQRVEDSVRALENCAGLDISAQFTLMIFHPDATLATLRADVAFMRRFSRNPLNFCRAEIYTGTPLEQRMIAEGRARGNYFAREYHLADPTADLACEIALDLFLPRCWSNGSLMQNAIGLDHLAAVAKRFHHGPQTAALCKGAANWLGEANTDTINLLEEVLDLVTSECRDATFQRALGNLRDRESVARQQLHQSGMRLRADLQQLRLAVNSCPPQATRVKFRRRAATAVLAIGIPAATACQSGCCEYAPPPLKQTQTQPPPPAIDHKDFGSLTGTTTDPSGAVVAKAIVTVTGLTTEQATILTTSESGQYLASDLRPGEYMVKVEANGFKTTVIRGIILSAGENHRADIKLDIGNWACCEYAAVPLQATPNQFLYKKKPFTYQVGEYDEATTFPEIAKLVYGDSKKWVQIFEANRDIADRPGNIGWGASITIPPFKRHVPKLISKVLPAYPPEALKQQISGDVILDVTLNEDGTVKQVDLIDGDAALTESATNAVKQWRYKPLVFEGKPVHKFVVVVEFKKGGKLSIY